MLDFIKSNRGGPSKFPEVTQALPAMKVLRVSTDQREKWVIINFGILILALISDGFAEN